MDEDEVSELNLNVLPGPFAPSDLSIDHGIDVDKFNSYADIHIHNTTILLREKVVIVGESCVGKTSLVRSFLVNKNKSKNKAVGGNGSRTSRSASASASANGNKNKPHLDLQEYTYDGNYHMTTGMDFHIAEVPVTDTNIVVDLFLYDMGGQGIFNQREMPKAFWKNCTYIVCVYDVSSRNSLKCIKTWLASVRSVSDDTDDDDGGGGSNEHIPALLVANKIDLREEEEQEYGAGEQQRPPPLNSISIAEVEREEGIQFAQENGMHYFECSVEKSKSVDINAPFQYIANQAAEVYQQGRAMVNEDNDSINDH